jgi:hypothetical protein
MMGRLNHDQGQLFYSFHLDEVVPDDHLVREIAVVFDLSWVHRELAAYYPRLGRPSIDPELMIRMLIVGYAFAIRSARMLCREVKVNMAYRWFCGLSIEDNIPEIGCWIAVATRPLSCRKQNSRSYPATSQMCQTRKSPDHSQAHDPSASSRALACFKSSVSKPSVNQP